jgi:hypothetical protein
MHGEGRSLVFCIEGIGSGQQGKGGIGRFDSVPLRLRVLKDCHKPITGGLIDVTTALVNAV